MVEDLLDLIESRYGTGPLVARVLSQKPHIFIPHTVK